MYVFILLLLLYIYIYFFWGGGGGVFGGVGCEKKKSKIKRNFVNSLYIICHPVLINRKIFKY